jgi:hypothetical protein
MRTILSISSELDKLYSELDTVQSMSEESVKLTFNADSKREYIELINEEIDSLENELEEAERYHGRKRNFIKTADLPYLCW